MDIFSSSDTKWHRDAEDNRLGFGVAKTKNAIALGKPIFILLSGVLCLWVFLYVSTIFPYLGTSERHQTKAIGASIGTDIEQIGTSTMLLVAGQTAFIDYEVDGSKGAAISLNVRPISQIGPNDSLKRIKGPAQGRAEFVIEKTGFYKFHHDFGITGTNENTRYSARWGAI